MGTRSVAERTKFQFESDLEEDPLMKTSVLVLAFAAATLVVSLSSRTASSDGLLSDVTALRKEITKLRTELGKTSALVHHLRAFQSKHFAVKTDATFKIDVLQVKTRLQAMKGLKGVSGGLRIYDDNAPNATLIHPHGKVGHVRQVEVDLNGRETDEGTRVTVFGRLVGKVLEPK